MDRVVALCLSLLLILYFSNFFLTSLLVSVYPTHAQLWL